MSPRKPRSMTIAAISPDETAAAEACGNGPADPSPVKAPVNAAKSIQNLMLY